VALRNADLYRQTPMVGIFQRRASGGGIGGGAGGAGGLWADRRVKRAAKVAGAVLVLCFVPIPWWTSGEAEVHPARRHHIRTDSAIVVDRIDVEEGQEVQAGQVLGTLRSEELAVRKSELEGKVRHSRSDAARLEGAGRSADARAARDQAAVFEAQLAIAERRLEGCTLRSPVRGWVLTRRPRDLVGTQAEAGRTVLEVAEAGHWIVEIKVPQESIPAAKAGQPVSFATPAAPGSRFKGRVVSVGVAGENSEAGVTFPVTGEVEDPGGALRAGMRGRGSVRLGGRFLGGKLFGGIFRWFRWKVGL
jgi:multidrug efflux pump subunit AcrA (membrane-fusion protein)